MSPAGPPLPHKAEGIAKRGQKVNINNLPRPPHLLADAGLVVVDQEV